MLGYISSITTSITVASIEEIFDLPIFFNPHTKLDFSSDNQYFYCIRPRNISDKFTIIKDLCRFLRPDFPTANHKRI